MVLPYAIRTGAPNDAAPRAAALLGKTLSGPRTRRPPRGTVAARITAQVRQIDGTFRTRFVDQPELLAGWRTAIKLNLPRAKSPESSDGSTPPAQSPTTPPAADEIKPAA